MMPRMPRECRCGWRRTGALAALSWTLSACHSTPVADRTAAETPSPPPPPPALVAIPVIPPEVQVPPPPSLPEEPMPKAKPKPKSKQVRPAPAGPPAPPAATVPGVVDAVVKPLDAPVVSILGKKVQSLKGEDLGRVVDVLADSSGRVRVAIIEFGGFLGVGNRRIPVDWSLLRFDPKDADKPLTLIASEKKLQSAPEYKDTTEPKTLMAPPASPAPPTPPAPPADNKK